MLFRSCTVYPVSAALDWRLGGKIFFEITGKILRQRCIASRGGGRKGIPEMSIQELHDLLVNSRGMKLGSTMFAAGDDMKFHGAIEALVEIADPLRLVLQDGAVLVAMEGHKRWRAQRIGRDVPGGTGELGQVLVAGDGFPQKAIDVAVSVLGGLWLVFGGKDEIAGTIEIGRAHV